MIVRFFFSASLLLLSIYCSWNLDYEEINTESCKEKADNEEFVCGNIWIDCRDGKEYKTVWIDIDGGNNLTKNGQCWMAENLNYGEFITIPTGVKNDGIPQKFCQDHDSLKCKELGGLYLWNEILDKNGLDKNSDGFIQGICPKGWHIPSKFDFEALIDIANNDSENLLKNSTTDIGFSAVYTGKYFANNTFAWHTFRTLFWTYETRSDEQSGNDRWSLLIGERNATFDHISGSIFEGYCLRCLKD